MKTIREEHRGKNLLRLVQTATGYSGIIVKRHAKTPPVDGEDAEEVWGRLERQLVETRPDYVGFHGARIRFRSIFREGFSDSEYLVTERNYKRDAKRRLDECLPLEDGVSATGKGEDVLTVYRNTNLLSPFEMMRVTDVLRGANADAFIQSAASFALEPSESALQAMKAALKPHDIAKWTAMTYLPFLWRPSHHMFLKPMATKDYASRVGHRFAYDYSPEISMPVYESVLDLAAATERELVAMNPVDRIDIQSFIWVVGQYSADDATM